MGVNKLPTTDHMVGNFQGFGRQLFSQKAWFEF